MGGVGGGGTNTDRDPIAGVAAGGAEAGWDDGEGEGVLVVGMEMWLRLGLVLE